MSSKRRQRIAVATFSTALAVTGLSRLVAGYCPNIQGPFRTKTPSIWLNPNIDDVICPASGCPNFTSVLRTSTAVWTEIAEDAASQLRPVYQEPGPGAPRDPGATIPGFIHVYGVATCEDAASSGESADDDGDGKTDWGKIKICAKLGAQTIEWGFPTISSFPILYYQGVLAHEFGHVLGFQHNSECGQSLTSVMSLTTNDAQYGTHLFFDDIQGYRALYGHSNSTFRAYETTDGLTWTPGNSLVIDEGTRPMTRVSACNSLGAASWTSYPVSPSFASAVLDTKYLPGSWTGPFNSVFGSSSYPTGIACGSGTSMFISWMQLSASHSTEALPVSSASTADGGAHWTAPVTETATGTGDGGPTRAGGTGAAFDPVTGLYAMVWRSNRNAVVLKVKAPNSPIQTFTGSDSILIRSGDTPAISCGPSSVGTENCVIVWDHVDWNQTIKWAHGHIQAGSPPRFVMSSVVSQGIVSYGSPSVAYRGGSSPWTLAVHQGGNTVFTFRKGNGTTAAWADQRSVSSGNLITSPGVGAAQAIGKGYLFFTSSN